MKYAEGNVYLENAPLKHVKKIKTQSTPLNIRSRPNLNAPIIGQIPKGASVKVLGQWENWYVVDYQGTVGYSSSDYITV